MIPVYGFITLENGLTFPWLQFVNPCADPKAEAVRIKCGQWKGCVLRCWTQS